MLYLGIGLAAMIAVLGMITTTFSTQADEQIIRQMLENAIARLNNGDLAAVDE